MLSDLSRGGVVGGEAPAARALLGNQRAYSDINPALLFAYHAATEHTANRSLLLLMPAMLLQQ